jgi:hypothetical protein
MFCKQVEKLDKNYPGGLEAYIQNARSLLLASKLGKNPFEGYIPSVFYFILHSPRSTENYAITFLSEFSSM